MNTTRALIAAGVIAFVIGIAEVLGVRVIPIPIDRTLVFVVGVLPLLQAYRVVRDRRHVELREATTPDPEVPPATPPPGADFEETLGRITGRHHVISHRGTAVQEDLRSIAITVLTRYGSYSRAEAATAVDNGTWTENPFAASFLGDEAPPPPLRERLRATLNGEPWLEHRKRETVDAIALAAGLPPRAKRNARFPVSIGPFGRSEDADRDAATTPGSTGEDADTARDPIRRETRYWRGISAVALVSLGVGVLTQAPAIVLTGIIGLAYGALAQSTTTPVVTLTLDRSVTPTSPRPGDDIDVTVEIENTGDTTLWDLRVVDGVPPALTVTDGSPRRGTTLRPGETTAITYTLTARRGHHDFAPPLILARNLANTVELETSTSHPTTIECVPPLQATHGPPPLRAEATRYAGQVATSTGGEGIEFHATRDYRAGDPLSRIDWNRWARTGEFATLEFREERAASVVLLIDARQPAYVGPTADDEHTVDRTVAAARGLFAALLDDGHQVGIAGLGHGECWLAPGAGRAHRANGRDLLALNEALTPDPPTTYVPVDRFTHRLRRQLGTGTQLIALSPLTDGVIGRVIGELDARGYPVSVIAPDPTAAETPGQRLAQVGRRLRISDLRSAGIPVVDWPWDDPLDAALTRHAEGGRP